MIQGLDYSGLFIPNVQPGQFVEHVQLSGRRCWAARSAETICLRGLQLNDPRCIAGVSTTSMDFRFGRLEIIQIIQWEFNGYIKPFITLKG